jgi:hypothetical protein
VEFSVIITKFCMETVATCEIVLSQRLQIHRLVKHIKNSGTSMLSATVARLHLALTDYYDERILKTFLGFLNILRLHVLMMKLLSWHHSHDPTTLGLHDSTVWRPYVHHVV